MDVTIVSPSPASPTGGDDLCEMDVTNVAIHSVTLLICLCGLVGNGAVLCLLSLKAYNAGIFDLTLTDFLFLLFTVPSTLLFLLEDVSCFPVMPLLYLRFLFQLSVLSSYWALFRLMYTSDIDYVFKIYKLYKLCCCCNLPERLLLLVRTVQYWAIFALFIVIPAATYLCPSEDQRHCQAALISVYAIILLLFPAPIVIPSTFNFIKAIRGSKKQQPKGRDIIVFLVVVFILLLNLGNFLQQLGYTLVSSQVFLLLSCIHSSIKPFIYFLAGRCWSPCSLGSFQLSLQRVFDEQKEKLSAEMMVS